MTQFEALFGIKASQVKRNCLLLPLLPKGILAELKIRKIRRGKLYGSADAADFTLVHTGMGPALAGDAVLYLKETPCRNIFLFGSCGLVREKEGLSIGSLVSPFRCFASESFTEILWERKITSKLFYPRKGLFEDFLAVARGAGVKKATCATIPSLKLEEDLSVSFVKKGIDVVDMECSAFFSAADFVGLKAVALFYISDIIKNKPFYRQFRPHLKLKLQSSIRNAAGLLCRFIKEKLSD